jgi:uncharacterized SAM-binding protein YcdF (DUF218 family)
MVLHLLLVFTPLADVLEQWLDVTQPARAADVLICLSGRDRRLIWTAELYHEGYAPRVVVSGPDGCGDRMRDRLILMGVPADRIRVDPHPLRTADHPRTVGRLAGIHPSKQRFLIVTDATHSRRAAACFRKAGYRDVTVCKGSPSHASYDRTDPVPWQGRVLNLPSVVYEYSALLVYQLRGWI